MRAESANGLSTYPEESGGWVESFEARDNIAHAKRIASPVFRRHVRLPFME